MMKPTILGILACPACKAGLDLGAESRLPRRLMLALSVSAIPLYYVHRLPVVGAISRLLLPLSMHPSWRWRWLDTFHWYTPWYQWKLFYPEGFRWFRADGFLDIEVFDSPIRMRGTTTA